MPADTLTITVLLASPGDVTRERGAVRRAVEEVNHNTGEAEGFHLVVKGWETHTRPAAGRPQGVINRQIGRTDIFLGIMWARLGTPTGKADSGTVEEYESARQRHKRSQAARKPSVMFYFKTKSPTKLRDLDLDQLAKVRAFRDKVMKDNLAAEFETAPELERLVRRHLTAEAREIAKAERARKRSRKRTSPSKKASAPTPPKPSATKTRSAPKKKRASKPKTPKAFAEAGFRSVRSRFERRAKAFSKDRPHIQVAVQREGDGAFAVAVTVYDDVRARARIAVGGDQGRPSLDYERGDSFPFYGALPTYRNELRVHVAEREGTLGFEPTARQSWTRPDALDQSEDVFEAFWERLTFGVV